MTNPYEYTLHEWLDHFKASSEFSLQGQSKGSGRGWAEEYFAKTYPNPLEASYKRRRFVAALEFLEVNASVFDVEKVAVVDPKASLLSNALVLTLFRFYGPIPEANLGVDHPSPEMILEMTKDYMSSKGWS
jgi:hypothetical protein